MSPILPAARMKFRPRWNQCRRGASPRDGQVARQARFRRQQIVASVIELPVREVKANGE